MTPAGSWRFAAACATIAEIHREGALARFPKWLRLSCMGVGGLLLSLHALTAVKLLGIGGDWLHHWSAGHAPLTGNIDYLHGAGDPIRKKLCDDLLKLTRESWHAPT